MIRWKIFFCFVIPIIITLEPKEYTSIITFDESGPSSSGTGVEIEGTEAKIISAGEYLIKGASNEGHIVVDISSVNIYLQNLNLTSNTTAPIIINSKLNDISITSLGEVFLYDNELVNITQGECATIKIKKKSQVTFKNENELNLISKCKNVIKGGEESSIKFEQSNGEYIIKGYKNGISCDNYLEFNGGKFIITTDTGDAIKSDPDDTDTKSEGKIVINNGEFYIESYEDGISAKKKIYINDGIFNIKTENGYDSTTFDKETMSAKGLKISNNETGSEMIIQKGEFKLNTADDAVHSKGNLTIINGNFEIRAGDDGVHAGFNLTLGEKDTKNGPTINIYSSYEGIEGQFLDIYYANIYLNASDDGINAATGNGGDDPRPGPGPGPHPEPTGGPDPGPGPGPGPHPHPPVDNDIYIAIYDGVINVLCKGDGIDSNGAIHVHGGQINVFSQGPDEGLDNEPFDHDGNFTIYDGEILCGGNKGIEAVHEGITKGNETFAYYMNKINVSQYLKIKDENGKDIRQHKIPKNIGYVFYSSLNLNEKYKFYVSDTPDGKETELKFTFGKTPGKDDGGSDSPSGSNLIRINFRNLIFGVMIILLL